MIITLHIILLDRSEKHMENKLCKNHDKKMNRVFRLKKGHALLKGHMGVFGKKACEKEKEDIDSLSTIGNKHFLYPYTTQIS